MVRGEKQELDKPLAPSASGDRSPKPIVLATKLYVPRPTHHLVPRPRLLAQLQSALQHRLTLVCAPAGYGKTTLLAEWAQTSPAPLAWVSLDEGDNDPARFWTYVISALQTLDADIGSLALRALQSTRASEPAILLNSLLNELSTLAEDCSLVLDDYHLITSQEVHRPLTFLVDHLPDRMHLVLASRTFPPFSLARLSVRDQLVEVREQDLRFTTPEIGRFFEQAHVSGLSAEDIDLLQAKTEGWVAGLQLVALSIPAQPHASSFVAHLTGSQRRIADFLMNEVLRQQPAHVQEFLLKTSVLERLCAPLCLSLLGDEGDCVRETLDYLEQMNLFLIPLDDERQWYRYHHLLTDFLRDRLIQTYPNLVPGLYRRASLWYEQEGLTALAIQTAIAGRDWEDAVRLIESNYEAIVRGAEYTTLLTWVEALPRDLVRSRPRLCLAKAWPLQITPGRLEQTEACLEDAERAILSREDLAQGRSEARSMLGEIAHVRSGSAILRNEPESSLELCQDALKFLSDEQQFLRGATSLHLGVGYGATGQFPAARRSLAAAMRLEDVEPNVNVGLFARHYLACVEALEGNLRLAAERCQETLKFGVLPDGEHLPASMVSHILLGGLLYEWNDLESARQYLCQGIRLSAGWWRRDMLIEAFITLARVKQAQGDPEGALQTVRQAEDLFEDRYLGQLLAHASAAQVRGWRQAGCLESVKPVVESLQRAGAVDIEVGPTQQEQVLAVARWLVTEGDLEEAGRWLASLVHSAERGGFRRRLIEALVLQALAFWGLANKRQATFALTRALELARPDGYVRVFVDEGATMRRMLERAARTGVEPDYTAALLAAFGPPMGQAPEAEIPAAVEPLSAREIELLCLIAAGLSTRETARQLVVAVETVRTHLTNIYGKLQVHSRVQAVQRARELDLL